MGRSKSAVSASEGHVADAATALLSKGNAVDAVVAGVFAAAAGAPGVLLGHVQLLLCGAGIGLRAVDGRVRQPGKGAPRPRGFTADQTVSLAARVGVPALPAALAAAQATAGSATLAQVMAPALALADGERRDVLRRIARRGAGAMSDDAIADELVAVCGRIAGGLLTREDLESVLPTIVSATDRAEAPDSPNARRVVGMPWAASVGVGNPRVHVVAACDYRGLLAIACYERHEDGVVIEALSLVAPLLASPVLRGEERVRPTSPIDAAAPIAVASVAGEGLPDTAFGIACDAQGDAVLSEVLAAWTPDGTSMPAYAGPGTLVGVVKGRDGAVPLAKH
jgi:gamma-glutamyltranspeptidase/glutathione hydrolase